MFSNKKLYISKDHALHNSLPKVHAKFEKYLFMVVILCSGSMHLNRLAVSFNVSIESCESKILVQVQDPR